MHDTKGAGAGEYGSCVGFVLVHENGGVAVKEEVNDGRLVSHALLLLLGVVIHMQGYRFDYYNHYLDLPSSPVSPI